VVVWDEVQTCI